MRAYKQLSYHAEIFDYMFGQGAVSPDGLKTLDDVKSSKLKVRKNLKMIQSPALPFRLKISAGCCRGLVCFFGSNVPAFYING